MDYSAANEAYALVFLSTWRKKPTTFVHPQTQPRGFLGGVNNAAAEQAVPACPLRSALEGRSTSAAAEDRYLLTDEL